MEKNGQTAPQQPSLRQEPPNSTGAPAYRPVNEGDSDQASLPKDAERHSESSQPQGENETLGTP